MPRAKTGGAKQSGKSSTHPNTKGNVVQPGADIVASMAEGFKGSLRKLIQKGIRELTIDLAGVQIVDSIGLGVVIATHNTLAKTGGKLTVINVSDDIYRLFKTMRLDQHFEVRQAAA